LPLSHKVNITRQRAEVSSCQKKKTGKVNTCPTSNMGAIWSRFRVYN